MNILHITPACYPASYWGGPVFTVYALNNALSGIPGVTVKTLTTDAAGAKVGQRLEYSQLAGLYRNQELIMQRRIAGASVSPGMLWELPALVRWADVVHLTGIYSFPTFPVLIVCRLLGKPLVWSPHGAIQDVYEWEGSRRKGLKRIWEILCNALVSPGRVALHVISEREKAPTQSRLPRASAAIVPNGVEIPAAIPERNWLPDGRLRLMYLGRLTPKKGIENLLYAMEKLDDPNVTLAIYGTGEDGYVASLHALAGKLGLSGKNVFFAGPVDGERKEQAFYQADVCIVPSNTECFCMVVAEALAHGVPVIASHGTPWEAVEEKQCGLWVDNSPDSLVRAIIKMRGMALPGMGARGREWMKQNFSWSVVARDMLRLYEKALQ